jgi:hypothetical protein
VASVVGRRGEVCEGWRAPRRRCGCTRLAFRAATMTTTTQLAVGAHPQPQILPRGPSCHVSGSTDSGRTRIRWQTTRLTRAFATRYTHFHVTRERSSELNRKSMRLAVAARCSSAVGVRGSCMGCDMRGVHLTCVRVDLVWPRGSYR